MTAGPPNGPRSGPGAARRTDRVARWLPSSLYGRVALIVCGGLALAHLLTVWIILRERGDQGRTMMLAYLGRDVATSVAILDRLPGPERAAWLPRLARQNYRYVLDKLPDDVPTATGAEDDVATALRVSIAAELGADRVGAMQSAGPGALALPLRLRDGSTVSLQVAPMRPTVSRATLALLGLQFAALALAAWLAVRLAVRPLTRLAAAADAIAPGLSSSPLDDAGPREVAQATRAFNDMQRRIAGHLTERMQILASVTHDLQTPITRMKLRTEALPDAALRERLHADLDGMQALVDEGLALARSAHAAQEQPRAIDLDALLDALVGDARDAGHAVTLSGRLEVPLVTRVQALRRIVGNLLDNALKFGDEVELLVASTVDEVQISVRDDGPGIPEDQLDAVLLPFHRVETSRNRETGGTGLGLAIALQLALACEGRLSLHNRDGGGLEARLVLPRHRR